MDSSALSFHEQTKHSEFSVRSSAHYLDWENRPSPFKHYKNLPSVPLSHTFPRPSKPSLRAIRDSPSFPASGNVDADVLAEILFFSAGITRKLNTRAGAYFMRAAPATGALYPIELYVVCRGIPGLGPGVYHFNPLDLALVRLRDGDYSMELAAACGRPGLVTPISLALTSFAWRNAWKYEARSYRHWFWDSGVIAANLLATSSSEGLTSRIDLGFVDTQVNRILGLSEKKEATVALAEVEPSLRAETERTHGELSQVDFEVEPLSREEVEYPLIWRTHEESELHSTGEVEAWTRSCKPRPRDAQTHGPEFQLRPLEENDSTPTLGEVILRRGSTRRFTTEPISFEHLSAIIDCSTFQIPLDFLPSGETLIDLYFIANDVQGLPHGSYFYDRKSKSLHQLRKGRFRDMAGYLCLEQPLFSDASVVFFLMTDLGYVLASMGNRGYRAAQFEGGIRAGKIYLSSYSLGLGASGSTFYDNAVTEFFSPHAKDANTIIAVGVGVPAYKAKPGRIILTREQSAQNALVTG